ncbi:menaquinone-dependent protoporphyrinogen oxidase [Haladaptatus litoreus]|uniref:Menaquinone-dependent protoporphyrinogen oxidase n=1 Tax=Haladaptatus litoreus TaxID=553468 RepID=A0A1N7E9H4_9EURY|nr:menaquinone-dependent protoporphyrinogen IX dehydrogenase [Haladaptatus litoreus]SIR84700.1 menaquinone-dependent protoporphyrinogen oxidase [Haladaptatus litoreus]
MARVLVLYGSTEGQTATIAERTAEVLASAGHDSTLIHGNRVPEEFRLSEYDAVVVGASVHKGHHQKYVEQFVREHAKELNRLPSAFFSVSLTAVEDTDEARMTAENLVTEFLAATGWNPDRTAVVAGALKYSRYGLLTRLLMKYVARKKGGGTDTSRDYEYTDWDEVERFATAFARSLDS